MCVQLYSSDFGAKVRKMFGVITDDSLSPGNINEIIGAQALDDVYSDFLLEQVKYLYS